MIFQIDNRNDPAAYAKELKFGNLLLKRAKRELSRLDLQIKQAHEYGTDSAALQVQFEQLQQSIAVFEQELTMFELQYGDGMVDASQA
ncbi:hypothetical protein [Alicyclobacillus pomorum]|uniref:hypothetical protein n=1 Tax=Alicyclobacillus pomorum TaxID=204470 RepID=UPI000429F5A8|nr:hypothetical protein [Alicyclobacillus pomorum]